MVAYSVPNEHPQVHNNIFFVISLVRYFGVCQAGFLRAYLPAPSIPSFVLWNLPRWTRLEILYFGKVFSKFRVHSSNKKYCSLSNFGIIHVLSMRLIPSRDSSY